MDTTTETLAEKAERLQSYWGRHGDNPEAVAEWAVSDLLDLLRDVLANES